MDSFLSHEFFMRQALKEAQLAFSEDEIPIGAVVVCNGTIVSRAHNMTEKLNDSTAHAEILALTSAMNHFGSKYLQDCVLYVTLEPCVMCAGASHWSQISQIVFGAFDDKKGYQKLSPELFNTKTKITAGILENESSSLLKEYFKKKRKF